MYKCNCFHTPFPRITGREARHIEGERTRGIVGVATLVIKEYAWVILISWCTSCTVITCINSASQMADSADNHG